MECTEEELSNIATTMQLEAILSHKAARAKRGVGAKCLSYATGFDAPSGPSRVAPRLHPVHLRHDQRAQRASRLSHQTIHDRVMAANQALRIGPSDTVMWCLPMSHHFLVTIVLYLSQGATIVLARHVLSRPFLEAVNRWQGTVLYAAPFHYSMLARDSFGRKLPSVRLAVSTTCSSA
jgi:long-chain acyl-CoA synthetase